MKASQALFLVLFLKVGVLYAQYESPISAGVDAGAGTSGKGWSPSISYHEEIGSRKLPWLRFAMGFKAWGYYSGQTELLASSKDILEFRNVSMNGLSLITGFNVVLGKVDLAVNTDLVGFGFGSDRNAYYRKTHLLLALGSQITINGC